MRDARRRLYFRMKRRLLNLLTALCLLLALAVAALWARSYWRFVDFGRVWHRRDADAYTQSLVRLGSARGTLVFTWRDIVWPWSNPEAARVSTEWEKSQNGWFWTSDPRLPDLSRGKRADEPGWEIRVGPWGAYSIKQPPMGGPLPPGRLRPGGPGLYGYVVKAPHALVCIPLALPAAAFAVRKWRRRRVDDRCPKCGYDLRATPGRCPECGTPASVYPPG